MLLYCISAREAQLPRLSHAFFARNSAESQRKSGCYVWIEFHRLSVVCQQFFSATLAIIHGSLLYLTTMNAKRGTISLLSWFQQESDCPISDEATK